jgi:hypothetical protein
MNMSVFFLLFFETHEHVWWIREREREGGEAQFWFSAFQSPNPFGSPTSTIMVEMGSEVDSML